jgi:hypothetical protein
LRYLHLTRGFGWGALQRLNILLTTATDSIFSICCSLGCFICNLSSCKFSILLAVWNSTTKPDRRNVRPSVSGAQRFAGSSMMMQSTNKTWFQEILNLHICTRVTYSLMNTNWNQILIISLKWLIAWKIYTLHKIFIPSRSMRHVQMWPSTILCVSYN